MTEYYSTGKSVSFDEGITMVYGAKVLEYYKLYMQEIACEPVAAPNWFLNNNTGTALALDMGITEAVTLWESLGFSKHNYCFMLELARVHGNKPTWKAAVMANRLVRRHGKKLDTSIGLILSYIIVTKLSTLLDNIPLVKILDN
jgi:hypothetical protein